MAVNFAEMEDRAISQANAASASDALRIPENDPDALLLDVRDESEAEATGLGARVIHAPGRSVVSMADLATSPFASER